MLRTVLIFMVLFAGQGVAEAEVLSDWLMFESGQRWEMLETEYEIGGDGQWVEIASQIVEWRVEATHVEVDDDVMTLVLLMGEQSQPYDGIYFIEDEHGLEMVAIGNPNGDGEFIYYWGDLRAHVYENMWHDGYYYDEPIGSGIDGIWEITGIAYGGLYVIDGQVWGEVGLRGFGSLDTLLGELDTLKIEIRQNISYDIGHGMFFGGGNIKYDVWLAEGIGPVRVEVMSDTSIVYPGDNNGTRERSYIVYELVPEPGVLGMSVVGGLVLLRRWVG